METQDNAYPRTALLPGKILCTGMINLLVTHSVKFSARRNSPHILSSRFVCNEAYEMSQRQVRFNVHELVRCAAKAVGAKSCIGIEKYPDGMYNKSMLLSMDDGAQVVAKVPNPNSGLAHFTTASEDATMDFVRFSLQVRARTVCLIFCRYEMSLRLLFPKF